MLANENGRSMVEMLGVLAIIGVMTVGGLNVIGRSRQMHELGQLVAEVSKVAMTAKKMACDYDAAYGSYTMFLYKSEAYSDELEYEDGKFIGPMDSEITISGDLSEFEVSVAGLTTDGCIQLAGNDWGKKGTNGFLGACVGVGDCSPSSDKQMELNKASSSCYDGSTVKLKFKACTN
ncbi:MAG: hypothetical protein IJ677_03390 [Alphaproteobacteria bacterium]|nr:hypothetical protein [Alphaproteobacteria bacterium]